MSERARLSGGPDRTSSSAYMGNDGSLVVECYDFGADDAMGGDVAFLVFVAPDQLDDLRARLGCDGPLPAAIAARFASYFETKAWLIAEGVPFRSELDSHA